MPYLVNTDFRVGVDRRRARVAGAPGSLWLCKNAHITRGGEIEKRKKFVSKYELPEGTFGMRVIDGTVYVFGSAVEPSGIPAGVTYQRLQHPTGETMTAVLDATVYDKKLYVAAEYADETIHHFYDGARVTAWDDGVITPWCSTYEALAIRLRDLINANADEVMTATASGNVLTLTAKANNTVITVTAEAINGTGNANNDQTAVVANTQTATVSLPQITTITFGGTVEEGDRFAVSIVDNEYGAGSNPATKGRILITHRSKVYALADEIIYFSSVTDPTIWRPDTADHPGAGSINSATREEGSLVLKGVGKYQGSLAFFADNAVQIWTLAEDPADNILLDTLDNTGTVAGETVTAYGNNDTFYLSRSGLRSLRARDSSDSAFVSDVGNAIDGLLIEEMRTLGASTTAAARSVIDPVEGRYWLILGSKIYVLSYFPGAKVTAWSWYEPGFSAEEIAVDSGRIYLRADDVVYLYGGDDDNTYDSTAEDNYEVVVGLPFQSTRRVAEDKVLTGYDLAVTNTWLIEALTDPRNENRKIVLGAIDETTYPAKINPASGEGTHFAMQMTCSTPGAATIVNMTLHMQEADSETEN